MSSGFIYSLLTFGKDVPLFRIGNRPGTVTGRVIALFWLFFLALLTFGLLRKRAYSVTIEGDELIARAFCGIGSSKHYILSESLGFTTTMIFTKAGEIESVNLLFPEKKALLLSGLYYKNYVALKTYLEKSVQNLGRRRYSFYDEIRGLMT
jgi:hypothetical protein